MPDELAQAQERLGRTLDRARASEDRELATRIRDEGFQLVQQLNGLLRMGRMHSLDNRALDQPVRELALSLVRLTDLLGTLHLAFVEDQLYLNEIRIRADERGAGGRELGAELARHGVGGLRIHQPLSEIELRQLVAAFATKPSSAAPRAALRQALESAGVRGLELLGAYRVRLGGEGSSSDQRVSAEAALARAGEVVREAFDNLGHGRLFNPLPARRAVAEILKAGLDRLPLDELPGLPAHLAHALRVCVLSLRIGRSLGLDPSLLQDLGVAALLHDVGFVESDSQGQPRPPTFAQHASAGVRLLLRQKGFHASKIRRLRAVLGHHAAARREHGHRPALLARILRIAEDYDSLVRRALLPLEQALGRMFAAGGTLYDPDLLQALVNLELGLGDPASELAPPRVTAEPAGRREPPVAARGCVTQGVPIRLMHDLLLQGSTGELAFEMDGDRRELHFVAGRVVAVDSTLRDHDLEVLLLRAGFVELEGLEWAREEARRTGRSLGRTLVEAGLLAEDRLGQALAQRARSIVADLIEWEDGQYLLTPASGVPAHLDLSEELTTDSLIVGAVRGLHDPDVVRFAIGDLGRVPVCRRDRLRPEVLALLLPVESALLVRVDDRTSARELLSATVADPDLRARALLVLLAIGLVDYRP